MTIGPSAAMAYGMSGVRRSAVGRERVRDFALRDL